MLQARDKQNLCSALPCHSQFFHLYYSLMVRLHFLNIASHIDNHGGDDDNDNAAHTRTATTTDDDNDDVHLRSLMQQYPHLLSSDFCLSMREMNSLPFDTAFKPLMQATIRLIAGEIVIRTAEELHDALRPLLPTDAADSDPQAAAVLTVEQLARHVKHMIWFVQNSIRHNVTVQQLMEDMASLGWGDESRRVFAAKLWRRHFVAMSRSMLQDTLQVHPLKDMDWRFGVVASSSELSQVGRTFLQMKISLLESLSSADPQSSVMKDVFLGMRRLLSFYLSVHLSIYPSVSVPIQVVCINIHFKHTNTQSCHCHSFTSFCMRWKRHKRVSSSSCRHSCRMGIERLFLMNKIAAVCCCLDPVIPRSHISTTILSKKNSGTYIYIYII